MSKIDDLINDLPEALQEIARRYVPLFQNAGMAEVEDWIGLIAAGNWPDACEYVISQMTTAESIAEQERLNTILLQLNAENAELVDAQKMMVREILLALVSLGISALNE